jgi:hypothetical protein
MTRTFIRDDPRSRALKSMWAAGYLQIESYRDDRGKTRKRTL